MTTWRIGLVGLRRGQGMVKVFANHPRCQIAALCDIDEDRLNELGDAFDVPPESRFTDYDRFVQEPIDVVVIATPIEFHSEQTIAALHGGKHVLCEQTAAYTIDDCQRIVDAVRETGRHYMMAENYTYFHYVRQWQQLVREGKLGDIFYAEGEYIHDIQHLMIDEDTGAHLWRLTRPAIHYCAHCLGPLLTLMDDHVVQACGCHSGYHRRPDRSEHIGYLDMEVALFRTAKGAVIKILRSQVAPRYPHLVYYSLYGTRGYVENGRHGTSADGYLFIEGEMSPADGDRCLPCPTVDPDAPAAARSGGHGTSEFYMVADFLDALEADRPPPIDVVRAMDMTVPGIIAHQSAMTGGGWLDVPQVGR